MKWKIAILIALYSAAFVLAMAGCVHEPTDKGKWNPWVPISEMQKGRN